MLRPDATTGSPGVVVLACFGNCTGPGGRVGPCTSQVMSAVSPSVMPRTTIRPRGVKKFVNVHSEPPEARIVVWVMTWRRGFLTPSQRTPSRRQTPSALRGLTSAIR